MALMTLMNANAFAAQKCHPQMTQMAQMNANADLALTHASIASDHPSPSPLSNIFPR
jgi:hypothetical protein